MVEKFESWRLPCPIGKFLFALILKFLALNDQSMRSLFTCERSSNM